MQAQEAIDEFMASCREKGLSRGSTSKYSAYLKHFAVAFPGELPTEWPPLDRFLNKTIKKKSARPTVRKVLQTFYRFLQRQGHITDYPIPKGNVGRPRKAVLSAEKLGKGGGADTIRLELHVFIHQ